MMLIFSSISIFSQKEIQVISFKQSTSDISARTNPREDPKGEVCALVKVQMPIRNALFDGDIIGEIAYKTNEYWIYMPQESSQLAIRVQGCNPLHVDFNNYNIPSLGSKNTYELCVLKKEGDVSQLYNEGMTALAKNDIVTAFERLEKLSEAGYAPAAYAMGNAILIPYDEYHGEDPNTTESYQEVYNYFKKAAEGSSPEGQYALANMILKYKRLKGRLTTPITEIKVDSVLISESKIWELIRNAANKGVVDAQFFMLSDDHWCKVNAANGVAIAEFGMGLRCDEELYKNEYPMLNRLNINRTEDFNRAFSWYQKAANHGLDVAQWRLGELYARGLGVEKDIDKAQYWRKMAAEQGSVIFQLILAMSYNYGEISNLETFESYGTSENALDSWGIEIPINPVEADYWLKKLNNHCFTYKEKYIINSNSMYSDAMYILAKHLDERKEYGKAIYWYQRTGEKDDGDLYSNEFYKSDALAQLGRYFCEGLSVKKDYVKAKIYWEKGLDNNSSEAACYLGILYRDGLGVTVDKEKAKEFFMKSIELEAFNCMALYELGNMYYDESKYDDALRYYREARSNSFDKIRDGKYVWLNEHSTKACYKLGLMYDFGQGVEMNTDKAVEYMTEAASRGSDEAKKYLQERNIPIPSPKLGSNAND